MVFVALSKFKKKKKSGRGNGNSRIPRGGAGFSDPRLSALEDVGSPSTKEKKTAS